MNLKIQNITKYFNSNVVLDDISFEVKQGSCVSLLGSSGCGKTTLLRIVAGLEQASSGQIFLGMSSAPDSYNDITSTPAYKRNMGMVFQSYALWPHMKVIENVSFPLRIQKLSKTEILKRAFEILKLVELERLSQRFPHELSGGQQQRVALARALVMQPHVLLLDEPLSNLDAKLREQMRKELKILQIKLNLTMLYVTHDQLEALELSDQIAILDQGKLIQFGTSQEIKKNPVNSFVAKFIS